MDDAPAIAPPAPVFDAPAPVLKRQYVKKPKKKPGRAAKAPKELPLNQRLLMLQWFPELFLGKRPYPWCFEALGAMDEPGSRVAVTAANGSGKTTELAAPAILWHMIRFEGGQTVVTAGAYRQVVEILWPVLRNKINGLPSNAEEGWGWDVTESRITYLAPGWTQPAICNGFSAEDPTKAEGWHARGAWNTLMFVIDEAKGVSDKIFEAMERCQPTRVLVVSSPGGRSGAFFKICNGQDTRYKVFKVTAYDCPHITREWIAQQIAIYGERSAFIQSMIFAEFGEEEGGSLVLPPRVLQAAVSSPPLPTGTELWAGVDFAAGGDENVIEIREGNHRKDTVAWREKDTMSAIGRFITEFKRHGLQADHIYCDAGGMGIPMCDALREAGWDVRRVNNGEQAHNPDHFANRGTEMWTQYARMVETGKVIVPADEVLHRQLTTRGLGHNSKGKLMLESKEKMRERGLSSPDRADAVILAFCGMGASMEEYMTKYGKRPSFGDMADEMEEGSGCHAG